MSQARPARSSRTAFTLIELLVVVSIIALLIAILLPSLKQSRAAARTVVCETNIRQYVFGNEMYADANNNVYVPIKTAHGTNGSGYYGWYANKFYMTSILNMKPSWSLPSLICPERPFRDSPNPAAFGADGIRNGGTGNTYGWNWEGVYTPNGWNSHIQNNRLKIITPDKKVHMADGTDWHLTKSMADYINRWDIYGEERLWEVAYRHPNESAALLYADGHGDHLTKYEMWPADPTLRTRLWNLYK
ncbi:MAG: prepilin-type N-terminal cleavage/methylation domain-containing protein [Phycisphaera sp.]|nr:prepilin-type N-terminal cleavage/methylation domain-containing protein [Phycisphaera sp.]